jgi:peptidoglycan/LPS O-acetylase OafA/YrhL
VSYDSKFDFYFPFCRFWQMAIGGLLAANIIKVKNTLYAHVLSTIGLITIFTASYFLSEANLYPGGWALFPTLASAAIIVAGESSIANKYILGNRLMVFLGKISYSLYLWHWPMLVLSRTFFPEGSE